MILDDLFLGYIILCTGAAFYFTFWVIIPAFRHGTKDKRERKAEIKKETDWKIISYFMAGLFVGCMFGILVMATISIESIVSMLEVIRIENITVSLNETRLVEEAYKIAQINATAGDL